MLEMIVDGSSIIRGETETEQGFIEELGRFETATTDPEVTDVELVATAADTTEVSGAEEVAMEAEVTGVSGVVGFLRDPSVKRWTHQVTTNVLACR